MKSSLEWEPMTPTLYALCGLAFAGKSTLAAELRRRLGAVVVSTDEINARRGLHGGDGLPVEEWARTWGRALAELERALAGGAPHVVLDDTCCFRFQRDDLRRLCALHGYRCRLLVLTTTVEEVRRRIARNAAEPRRSSLRPEVFEEHLAGFQWPGDDEAPECIAPDHLAAWLHREAAERGDR